MRVWIGLFAAYIVCPYLIFQLCSYAWPPSFLGPVPIYFICWISLSVALFLRKTKKLPIIRTAFSAGFMMTAILQIFSFFFFAIFMLSLLTGEELESILAFLIFAFMGGVSATLCASTYVMIAAPYRQEQEDAEIYQAPPVFRTKETVTKE